MVVSRTGCRSAEKGPHLALLPPFYFVSFPILVRQDIIISCISRSYHTASLCRGCRSLLFGFFSLLNTISNKYFHNPLAPRSNRQP